MAKALGREGDELVAKMNLGSVAFDAGDDAAAIPLWTDVLDYHRTSGTPEGQGLALLNLGLAALPPRPDHRRRNPLHRGRRPVQRDRVSRASCSRPPGLAATAAAEGRDREAASLLGQAAALLEETGSGDGTFDASLAQETEADLRARLGDQAFSSAFAPRAQHGGRPAVEHPLDRHPNMATWSMNSPSTRQLAGRGIPVESRPRYTESPGNGAFSSLGSAPRWPAQAFSRASLCSGEARRVRQGYVTLALLGVRSLCAFHHPWPGRSSICRTSTGLMPRPSPNRGRRRRRLRT